MTAASVGAISDSVPKVAGLTDNIHANYFAEHIPALIKKASVSGLKSIMSLNPVFPDWYHPGFAD
jgi:hypothetical protein